jgi:hypothetical protein
VKVDTYIHGTKATTYKRHETISKYNRVTRPGFERLLWFVAVGIEPDSAESNELYATTRK